MTPSTPSSTSSGNPCTTARQRSWPGAAPRSSLRSIWGDACRRPGEGACDEYRPHPEELAKQASRRMDTTHGLADILRDSAKRPLLRKRSEIYISQLERQA